MDTSDKLHIAGLVIQGLGLVLAFLGIGAWHRELKGKKRYELAEEVLTLVYLCRDALKTIRDIHVTREELESRKQRQQEFSAESRTHKGHVVFQRYEHHRESFARLATIRFRFKALFGKDAVEPVEDLLQACGEVLNAARQLSEYNCGEDQNAPLSDHDQKERRRLKSIVDGTQTSKDQFNNRINEIVGRFEETCSPILGLRSRWRLW